MGKSGRLAGQFRQRRAAYARKTHFATTEPLEPRSLLSVSLDASGWTVVDPSIDTQIVYVSSSEGSDANTGLSPSSPVQSIAKGVSLLRNGSPDWLLLKRGDAWNEGLGSWKKSGRSANEPMLVSSYGDSAARPQLNTPGRTGMVLTDPVSYLDIMGLSFAPQTIDTTAPSTGIKWLAGTNGFLVEDCSFQAYGLGINVEQAFADPIHNVAIRRSQIVDSWDAQGIFMDRVDGILIEENLLDHNGWNTAVGTSPTIFNHNVYLTALTSHVIVRGNILANASSHGLQARGGGQIVNNLFINNPIGMSFGFLNGSAATPGGVSGSIRGNVFLGDRDINGKIRGWGIEIGNTSPGGNTTIEDNIVAHSTQRAFPAIQFNYGSITNPDEAAGINDLTVQRNVIYDWYGGFEFRSTLVPGGKGAAALNGLTIRDNQIQAMSPGPSVNHASPYDPAYETWSNNQYFNASDPAKWFKLQGTTASFDQWQSTIDSTAINAPAVWPDPDRTVADYNASIGGPGTLAAFLAAARQQSHATWQPQLSAISVIDYIREGFGLSPIETIATPTDLESTAVGTDTVQLTWADQSDNETGCIVERRGETGAFVRIAALLADSTTFLDSDLDPETHYVYRVAACTATSLSEYSEQAHATTLPLTPAAPDGLIATAVGAERIELAWTDNSDNETGFIVQRMDADGNFAALAALPPDTTTFTDADLTPATLFTYRVLAVNEIVFSDAAGPATATALPLPPVAPSGLSASAKGTTQIQLAWTDNSANETGFRIERRTAGNDFVPIAILPADCATYTDSTLSAGTRYDYRVVTVNEGGEALSSSIASAMTHSPAPAGTGLRASYYVDVNLADLRLARTDSSVNFNWGGGSPSPAIPSDSFSVRWLGQIQPAYSETYTFYAACDDGVRLWINNRLLIDKWTDHALRTSSGRIQLQAGRKYDIRLEHYERRGAASIRLMWSSASQHRAIVPQSRLYPAISASLARQTARRSRPAAALVALPVGTRFSTQTIPFRDDPVLA